MRRASLATMLAALLFTNACASAAGTAGGAGDGGGGGFRVGAQGVPTTISADQGEDVSGTGVGVMLGFGFSRNVALYASVDAGPVEADESYGDASHLDLGAEYAFDAPGRRFVPYVRGGFSTLVLYSEYCDDFTCYSYDADGSGFAIGGGVRFFALSALALDLGADFGTYTLTADSDFGSTDIDVSSTRLKLGATLQFGRGGSGGEETRGGGGGPK